VKAIPHGNDRKYATLTLNYVKISTKRKNLAGISFCLLVTLGLERAHLVWTSTLIAQTTECTWILEVGCHSADSSSFLTALYPNEMYVSLKSAKTLIKIYMVGGPSARLFS
jgi:hypothetical protein